MNLLLSGSNSGRMTHSAIYIGVKCVISYGRIRIKIVKERTLQYEMCIYRYGV